MPFTEKDGVSLIDFFNFFKVRGKNDIVYQNIMFPGLLCVWLIYYKSNYLLIPFKVLSIVCIATDIFITLCFFRFYKKNFSLIWALIHNLTIGFIACYLFVWTNDNLSTQPVLSEVLLIERVNLEDNHQRHNRGLAPVLTVNIKGINHEIYYDKSAVKEALDARQVEVELKEGFWGYWVLKSIQLVDNK